MSIPETASTPAPEMKVTDHLPAFCAELANRMSEIVITPVQGGAAIRLLPNAIKITGVSGATSGVTPFPDGKNLSLRIQIPGLEGIGEPAIAEAALKALATMPKLKEYVNLDIQASKTADNYRIHDLNFDYHAQHEINKKAVLKKLTEVMDRHPEVFTAEIKQRLSGWSGFQPAISSPVRLLGGIDVAENSQTIMNFNVAPKGGNTEADKLIAYTSVVQNNLDQRLEQVKDHIVSELKTLAEKARTANPSLISEEDIQGLSRLTLITDAKPSEMGGGTLAFGFGALKADAQTPPAIKDLEPIKLLQELDQELVKKIIHHAVLNVGDKASEVYANLASRDDIRNELKSLLSKTNEPKEVVDALFEKGPLFDYNDKPRNKSETESDRVKPRPIFIKSPLVTDKDTLTVDITFNDVPAQKVLGEIMEALRASPTQVVANTPNAKVELQGIANDNGRTAPGISA